MTVALQYSLNQGKFFSFLFFFFDLCQKQTKKLCAYSSLIHFQNLQLMSFTDTAHYWLYFQNIWLPVLFYDIPYSLY